MFKYIAIGFSIGFSMALSCISFCGVIFIPLMAAKRKNMKEGLLFFLQLSIGRFLGYFLFGFLAGYLGAEIDVRIRLWFTAISFLLLAPLILLYTQDFLTRKIHSKFLKRDITNPMMLGFITGMNFCPAFLALFMIAFEAGSLLAALLLFASFYIITTLFLGVILIGVPFSRLELVQKVARMFSVLISIYLIIEGVKNLLEAIRI